MSHKIISAGQGPVQDWIGGISRQASFLWCVPPKSAQQPLDTYPKQCKCNVSRALHCFLRLPTRFVARPDPIFGPAPLPARREVPPYQRSHSSQNSRLGRLGRLSQLSRPSQSGRLDRPGWLGRLGRLSQPSRPSRLSQFGRLGWIG